MRCPSPPAASTALLHSAAEHAPVPGHSLLKNRAEGLLPAVQEVPKEHCARRLRQQHQVLRAYWAYL